MYREMKPFSCTRLWSLILLCSTLGFWHPASAVAADSDKPTVKNIKAEEADQLLRKQKETVILDIRTQSEYQSGHLAKAVNLDFYADDFQKKLEKLDKKQVYLLHCASGGRSSKARDLMKKLGFETIYHLDDGIKGWIKAGKPVVK